MILLEEISEAAIVETLKKRYAADLIYVRSSATRVINAAPAVSV